MKIGHTITCRLLGQILHWLGWNKAYPRLDTGQVVKFPPYFPWESFTPFYEDWLLWLSYTFFFMPPLRQRKPLETWRGQFWAKAWHAKICMHCTQNLSPSYPKSYLCPLLTGCTTIVSLPRDWMFTEEQQFTRLLHDSQCNCCLCN